VVFDIPTLKTVQGLLQSILLTAIVFLIVMVFVMIAAKISTGFLIAYLSFYSFVPLMFFPWFRNGTSPFLQIVRMITDARESCARTNLKENFFDSAKNFLKRNLVLIFIGIIYLGAIGKALIELDNLHSVGLRHLSKTTYSFVFLIPIIIGLLYYKTGSLVKLDTFVTPTDPEAPDEPELAVSTKLLAMLALMLEAAIGLPFAIVGWIFYYIIVYLNKDLANMVYDMCMLFPSFVWGLLKQYLIPKQYILEEDNAGSSTPSPLLNIDATVPFAS